jgi:hypothetical protein
VIAVGRTCRPPSHKRRQLTKYEQPTHSRPPTWSAAKPSIPCFSLSTAIWSAPWSASKAALLMASRRPSGLAAPSGERRRGRGSVEASSSDSSAGAMVMLSQLGRGFGF